MTSVTTGNWLDNVLYLLPVMKDGPSDNVDSAPAVEPLKGLDARLAEACIVWTAQSRVERPWYVIGEHVLHGRNKLWTGLLLGSPTQYGRKVSDYASAIVSTSEWERYQPHVSALSRNARSDISARRGEFDNRLRTFIRPLRFRRADPDLVDFEMSRQGSTTLKGQLEYVLGSQEGLYDELLGQHETARYRGS